MGKRALKKKHPEWSEKGEVKNYRVNRCLVDLGAPPEEVYYTKYWEGSGGSYYGREFRPTKIRCYRSIYDRYTKDELWTWAQNLYDKKIRECHPDKHMTSKVFWTEYTKYINQIFDRISKILKRGKYATVSYHRSS